jgi:hypothetical protein
MAPTLEHFNALALPRPTLFLRKFRHNPTTLSVPIGLELCEYDVSVGLAFESGWDIKEERRSWFMHYY